METARLGEQAVSGEEECRRRMMLCFQLIMVPVTSTRLCDIDHRASAAYGPGLRAAL
jgi:hypothetical protein